MRRRNGIAWPWNFYQVFLWVCLVSQLVLNNLSVIPVLQPKLKIFYSVLYCGSFACTLIFGVLTTFSNPTDNLSTLGLVVQNKGNSAYCALCKSSVNIKSKHCIKCNRCVINFDHHCKWINNCIGQKNYRIFIFTLLFYFVNSFSVFCFTVLLILNFSLNEPIFNLKIEENFNKNNSTQTWIVEISILILYSSISSILLSSLLLFHLYLKIKKITTFEYIYRKKAKGSKVSNTHETIAKESEVPGKPEEAVN